MIIQCKTVTYFNAEAQRRVTAAQAGLAICSEPSRAKRVPRVRRGSWSEKLEFRVGVGEWWVRGQESGVRSLSWSSELELESGGSGVRGQESVVSSWSSELELESAVGGGAKV